MTSTHELLQQIKANRMRTDLTVTRTDGKTHHVALLKDRGIWDHDYVQHIADMVAIKGPDIASVTINWDDTDFTDETTVTS